MPRPEISTISERSTPHASSLNHAPESLLRTLITNTFRNRIALVSSFGAEAAVLLHMVATINPDTPVLFLNTGKLFGETLRYRDLLVSQLKLTNIRTLTPNEAQIAAADSDGMLWSHDAGLCCQIRKVEPLQRALNGFDAWINGRKSHHGGDRGSLPLLELEGPRIKVTPLAHWRAEDVDAYVATHDLPPHPLVEDGFLSIGCMSCTSRVAPGADIRSGRWADSPKTECGLHTVSAKATSI
jgi:phosphoadenosine phosphosulfate reductase